MTLAHVLEAARQLHQIHPQVADFGAWPTDLVETGLPARAIPAVSILQGLDLTNREPCSSLAAAVQAAAHLAHWKRTYTEDEVGADFRNRYGYFELFGPTGHYHSTQLRGYVAFWDHGLNYDWHSHEAEELYLILSGGALFKTPTDTRQLGSNQIRHHASWESHAMRTTDQPILAFVLWRGDGIADIPRMDAA